MVTAYSPKVSRLSASAARRFRRKPYADYFGAAPNTGYETLRYDVMTGDSTLFHRADIVEAGWTVVDPVLRATAPRIRTIVVPCIIGSLSRVVCHRWARCAHTGREDHGAHDGRSVILASVVCHDDLERGIR